MRKLIILLFIFNFGAKAQKADSAGFKSFVNVTFGNKFINREVIKPNSEINFFNYSLENDNLQIGLQFRKSLKKRDAITLSFLLYSDLWPGNIELAYTKLLTKRLGYFVSAKTYSYYFGNFPILKSEGDFLNFQDANPNLHYANINQPSFNIGPVYYLSGKNLSIESKVNFGFGGLGKFKEGSYFKSPSSFEVRKVVLTGQFSHYFLFMPDINISYFPLIMKKSKIGFVAHGNYFNASRSFNYQTTIYRWTIDQVEKKQNKGSIQKFNNYEINLGLVWQMK